MRYVTALAAVFVLTQQASLAAEPPSAEETVAFILYGVEDGALVQTGSSFQNNYQSGFISQTEKTPAHFIVPDGLSHLKSLSVDQIDPCVFKVTSTDESSSSHTREYDFNKFSVLTYDGNYWSVRFAGRCPIVNADGSCSKAGGAIVDYSVSVARLQMAADFLKREYCSGAPF